MTERNPIVVVLLTIVTIGIYGIVWLVTTKGEMNARGAQIPTAWLLIIPFVNIYWLWKYAQGVEEVTSKGMTAPIAFILLFLLGMIGAAIIQVEFNKLSAAPASAAA
jgi:uncharacterized membrane protein YozB (DUF420 family)